MCISEKQKRVPSSNHLLICHNSRRIDEETETRFPTGELDKSTVVMNAGNQFVPLSSAPLGGQIRLLISSKWPQVANYLAFCQVDREGPSIIHIPLNTRVSHQVKCSPLITPSQNPPVLLLSTSRTQLAFLVVEVNRISSIHGRFQAVIEIGC